MISKARITITPGEVTLNTKLPEPLGSYFEAVNREDVDAMLAPFAANAVVRDEGQTRSGVPELREWIEEVTEKYHPRFEVEDVVTEGAEGAEAAIVMGLVSGTFPGSPVRLRYTFRLSGRQITHLEIK
jgi:ketosteroid isomerase-like protein